MAGKDRVSHTYVMWETKFHPITLLCKLVSYVARKSATNSMKQIVVAIL